jgi:hypothetical protein
VATGCGASATAYATFRDASEAYLEMDRDLVAGIGAAQLGGDPAAAVALAKEAVPLYERRRDALAAVVPLACYRDAHVATLAAVEATLAAVRRWAGGSLPAEAEAEGFYRRYELKPQWKHTLDSAAVPCGG